MSPRRLCPMLVAGALTLGATAPAAAQVIGGEAAIYSIRYQQMEIQQFAVPFGLSMTLGPVRLDANSAYASATLHDPDGVQVGQLDGVTDVTTRLMLTGLQDRVRLIVSANLPTGTASLDPAQDLIAAAIGTQLFAFPVASVGSGFGVTTAAVVAQPIGDWVLGVSGGYRMGGAYEPLAAVEGITSFEFRPGSETRIRAAVDRPIRNRWSMRLAGSWSRFDWDQQDGNEFFRAGNRLVVEGLVEAPVAAGNAIVYGWHMARQPGMVRDTVGAVLNAAASRNLTGVGTRVNLPLSRRLVFRPAADLYYQDTAETEGATVRDGYMLRAGAGLAVRLGRGLVFEPAARGQFGVLDGDSIQGFVFRAGMAWRW